MTYEKRRKNMYISDETGRQIEALLVTLGDKVADGRGYPSPSALLRVLVAEKCAELGLKVPAESNEKTT